MRRFLLALTLAAACLAGPASASADLVAPPSACPNQSDPTLPAATQQTAMLCMVNYARRQSGRPALAGDARLMTAASRKANDIATCNEFSHNACGLPFDQRIRDAGYVYSAAGENIAWGSGSYRTVRSIMSGWLGSSGHRANILSPAFRDQGVGVLKTTFKGYANAQIWVSELARPH